MNHDNHYKVYNLCIEHSYDWDKFAGGVVAEFPFEDHQTPPMNLIKEFCLDAEAWLAKSQENVIAVHCKAGKGRTGIMVCCLLIYLGICADWEAALELFGERRSTNKRGVTIASQQRYVMYFNQIFKDGMKIPQPKGLELKSISVTGLPKSIIRRLTIQVWQRDVVTKLIEPIVTIKEQPKRASCNPGSCIGIDGDIEWGESYQVFRDDSSFDVAFDNGEEWREFCTVKGDVKIQVFAGTATKSNRLFYAWVNTSFLRENVVRFGKTELDKVKNWIPDDVNLSIVFDDCDHSESHSNPKSYGRRHRPKYFHRRPISAFDGNMTPEDWSTNVERRIASESRAHVQLAEIKREHKVGKGASYIPLARTGSLPGSLSLKSDDFIEELVVNRSGFSWSALNHIMRKRWERT